MNPHVNDNKTAFVLLVACCLVFWRRV